MTNNLPKSYYKRRKSDLVISRDRRILVLPDIHCPYHDVSALNTAIFAGRSYNVDTVIILGDMMDFHRISKYPNDPGTLSFQDEIKIGSQMAASIRENFPSADIYYIEGNHEVRLEHYIQRNAEEFRGMASLSLVHLLSLDDGDITFIQDAFIHCGDVSFLHGHELRGIGGVNPSRKLFSKMKKSAVCGHLHRPESFYTRDGAGKLLQCHVLGHLGDPNPNYHPRNDWQHGYGIVDVTKRGYVYIDNVIIDE
jgi:predicted phosphodiesterase